MGANVSHAPVQSIALVPSRQSGKPTAQVRRNDGRAFFLHSCVDPVDEGRFLAAGVESQERTLYVVLGFGLGYHVRALLERVPQSSHVIVVEPQAVQLSAFVVKEATLKAARWMRDPRLHLLPQHDPRLLPIHLADRMVSLRLLAITLVPHLPSVLTAEPFYRAALVEIPRAFPSRIQHHLTMIEQSLENDLRNFWANLGSSWRGGDIDAVAGAWADRPLIIVSSGPSLAAAIPQLRACAGTALIVATGSTAALLLNAGVRPDIIVAVDPYPENLGHFEGWDGRGIPLVHYQRVYRKVIEVYGGPRVPFVMQDEPPLPLRGARSAVFHRGGTVAFSALQLAHWLEANPIVFVGQDLAFAEGRTHTKGATHSQTVDAATLPDGYLQVEGASGGMVVTSQVFHAFLLHMQEYVLNIARQRPGVRHINTALAGARIHGMEYVDLTAVCATMAPLDPTTKAGLHERLTAPAPGDRDTQVTAVTEWTDALHVILQTHGFEDEFPVLFAAFRKTALYRQASKGYDDIFYLYEARHMATTPGAGEALCRAFREHLRHIAADLSAIAAQP